MAMTANERLAVILGNLKKLLRRQRALIGRNDERSGALWEIVTGEIDGLCEEFEKEAKKIVSELKKDKAALRAFKADLRVCSREVELLADQNIELLGQEVLTLLPHGETIH